MAPILLQVVDIHTTLQEAQEHIAVRPMDPCVLVISQAQHLQLSFKASGAAW